jgi:prepilin-type processing-associated H-X9-DG protein
MASCSTHGFTLVELLAVVSCVIILLSLSAPVLRAARDAADASACMSRLRQVAVAAALWTASHEGELPTVNTMLGDSYRTTSCYEFASYVGFGTNIAAYRNSRAITCTAARKIAGRQLNGQEDGTFLGNRYHSWNDQMRNDTNAANRGTYLLATIEHPSRMALLLDAGQYDVQGPGALFWGVADGNGWYPPLAPHRGTVIQYLANGTRRYFLDGISNVLFVDGHAQSMGAATDLPILRPPGPATSESYRNWLVFWSGHY